MDAGDALFRVPVLARSGDPRRARGQAALVARALVRMGVAAVNVGRTDLAGGLEFLEELGRDPGVPWISSNLADPEGRRPFPAWRVVPVAGLRVGVVGLCRPDPGLDRVQGVRVGPPEPALRKALAELRDQNVDVVVCLSNLGLEAEKTLARAVPGVAVIVGGGDYPYLPDPPVVRDTVILRASNRGRYLGVFEVEREAFGRWRRPRSLQEQRILEARLEAVGRQLRGPPPDALSPARRRALENERARIRRRLADQTAAVFEHRIVPLDGGAGEDVEIARWVSDFMGGSGAPRRALSGASRPAGGVLFTGSAACRGCHPVQYRRWARTRHARAYRSLQGKKTGAECLACHAVRQRRAAGVVLEPMVGCEACHGPGGNHRGRGNVVRRPPPGVCVRCHRGFHDEPSFDYREALRRLECGGVKKTEGER